MFDIQLQGSTVQSDYDIFKAAGAPFKATALNVHGDRQRRPASTSTWSTTPTTGQRSSGIEVYAANADGVANPTVNLQLSADDGTTWSTIATNLTMDRFGRGSYAWTIPTNMTSGNQYLIQAVANQGTQAAGTSPQPFLIATTSTAITSMGPPSRGGITTAPAATPTTAESVNPMARSPTS